MDKPGLRRVIARRGAIAVALVLLLLVPSVALMWATGQPAASYAAMGVIVGVVAVVSGGLRIATLTAIVLGLSAPLAIVAGLSPVTGAALMALLTLVVGRMSTFGLHRAVMLVPVFIAWPLLSPVPWLPREQLDRVNELLATKGLSVAQAINAVHPAQSGSTPSGLSQALVEQRMDSTYLAWVALFFLIGAIIPVLLGALLRHRLPQEGVAHHPRREAVPYTVTITVLTSAATFYFLSNPGQSGGAFLIATILVLTQVGTAIQWRLTIERVLGTLAGVVLLIVVMKLLGDTTYVELIGLPVPLTLYSVGILFGALAIMAKFSPRHWIYYILITPTTALLNAFTLSQSAGMGEARLVDNLVGASLVVVAALITLAATRLAGRVPVPQ